MDMAETSANIEVQRHQLPRSRASSTSSTSSTLTVNPVPRHDWIARQMHLRRLEYIEPLNIRVKVVSWNVNGKRITEDLSSLLLEDSEPGIYAIG
jgi:hypothetical protein